MTKDDDLQAIYLKELQQAYKGSQTNNLENINSCPNAEAAMDMYNMKQARIEEMKRKGQQKKNND